MRGTNEKKAVYEIIPDAANNNTGIIKEGGLSARYCLMKDLEPYDGAAQGEAAVRTMFFGNPRNIELDLFSKYEIQVSSDFAFTSLMDTILGDAELGCDLTVKNGLVALTVPAAPKQ